MAAMACIWVYSVGVSLLMASAYGSGHLVMHGGLQRVTKCGGVLNGTHGFIQTPNFPRRFPTPISCRWLLIAPPRTQIFLYFTQYYLRESFQLIEFDYYKDDRHNRGRHDIIFEDRITWIRTIKPYLLLQFQVETIGNIHLRVDEFLLDVYGFNITYEIVPAQETVPRPDACSVYMCSFLGNCLATANFESYKCHCFTKHFGDKCQYGPYCNPANGTNMCYNGGKCRNMSYHPDTRQTQEFQSMHTNFVGKGYKIVEGDYFKPKYFQGSLVNICECPPGYTGPQCEKKQEITSGCQELGCDQRCEELHGHYRCTCDEEYRLAADNKTCLEKGRMRYQAVIRGQTSEDRRQLCANFEQYFKSEVTSIMQPQLNEFQNLTVLNISYHEGGEHGLGHHYIDFFFIAEKADNQIVWSQLDTLLTSANNYCDFRYDPHYRSTNEQPAVHSLSVSNHNERIVYEDKLLTLVCKVKGSDGLKFQWMKDGSPIDERRADRSIWEVLIPSSDHETRRSILNIDQTDRLDAGTYTCIVSDWGEVRQKSIVVEIRRRPFVEVIPLAATVPEGGSLTVTCLSREDHDVEWPFKYDWFLGNRRITSGAVGEGVNSELAEDVSPVGSIINIQKAVVSQVYTCVVQSEWGTVRESSNITVIPASQPVGYCPLEIDENMIPWDRMAENTIAIARCPLDSTGNKARDEDTPVKTHGHLAAKAFRRCDCTHGADVGQSSTQQSDVVTECIWQEPDLRLCRSLSHELAEIKEELRRLKLGYICNNTMSMFRQLDLFLRQQTTTLLSAADLNMTLHILIELTDYARLYAAFESASIEPRDAIHTASLIYEQYKQSSCKVYTDEYFSLGLLRMIDVLRMEPRNGIEGRYSQITGVDLSVFRILETATDVFSLYNCTQLEIGMLNPAHQKNQRTRRDVTTAALDNHLMEMMVTTYDNLRQFMPNQSLEESNLKFDSPIISVAEIGNDLDLVFGLVPLIRIKYRHEHIREDVQVANISMCLSWSFRDYPDGTWSADYCSLLEVTATHSTCICETPGHFALARKIHVAVGELQKAQESGYFIVLGCAICLTSSLLTLFIRLILWRVCPKECKHSRGVIVINFCASLILFHLTLMFGLDQVESEVTCRIITLLLAFFAMSSLVFLLLETVHVFLIHVRKLVELTVTKVMLAGWGLPTILLLVSVIFSEIYPMTEQHNKHCWLYLGEWQFYGFVVVAWALLLFYGLLSVILLRLVTRPTTQDGDKALQLKHLRYGMLRSAGLVICLCVMLAFSVSMLHERHTVHTVFFTVAAALLGLLLLVTHGAVHIKKHWADLQQRRRDKKSGLSHKENYKREVSKSNSNGSFKAFLKPFSSKEMAVTTNPSNYLQHTIKNSGESSIYKKDYQDQKRALLVSGSGSSELQFPSRTSSVDRRGAGTGQLSVPSTSTNSYDISQHTGSTQITISDLDRSEHSHPNYSSKGRHNQNSLCSCSKCGSSFPFRPARGRAYISDAEGPLLSSSGNSGSILQAEDSRDSAVSLNSGKSTCSASYKKNSPNKSIKNTDSSAEGSPVRVGFMRPPPRSQLWKDSGEEPTCL